MDDAVPSLGPPVVRLFREGARAAEWPAPPGRQGALAFAADGRRVALAAPDAVREWSLPDGAVLRDLVQPGEPAWVGYLGDGTLCAATSRQARCHPAGGPSEETPGARAPTRAAAITAERVLTGTFEAVEVRARGAAPVLATVEGRAAAVLARGDRAWLVFEDRALSLDLATGRVAPGHSLKRASR
jgi:hypothetical protein